MREEETGLPVEQAQFYQQCADILGIKHEFTVRYAKRTRWNHRNPGNGRFSGYGTIRWFSRENIHLAFHSPLVTMTFSSPDECLGWLNGMMLNHACVPIKQQQ